jgi:hypothetical protein
LARKKINEHGAIINRRANCGRHRITNVDDDANLLQFLRQYPFETAIQAREQTNFLGSISTVRRRIRESELNNRSAANKPFLTAENKRMRLQFAHQFVDNE